MGDGGKARLGPSAEAKKMRREGKKGDTHIGTIKKISDTKEKGGRCIGQKDSPCRKGPEADPLDEGGES